MYKIDSIDYTNKTTFVFNIATLKKGISNKKTIFWSRGLVRSREKNGRDSRTRETHIGEKIAATTIYYTLLKLFLILPLKILDY